MKNISKQDLYLSEQVKTSLKNSIPQISKNIYETLLPGRAAGVTPYSPGLKGVGEKIGLFGKQLLHIAAENLWKTLAKSAAKNEIATRRTSRGILFPKYGSELELNPSHISNVLRTYPETRPIPPQREIEHTIIDPTTKKKKIVTRKNVMYPHEFAVFIEQNRQYEERQKLERSIGSVRALNRQIGRFADKSEAEEVSHAEASSRFAERAKASRRAARETAAYRYLKSRPKPSTTP